jgi:hypothetical protein
VRDAPLFDEWVAEQRERLRLLAVSALQLLADAYTQQGNTTAASATLNQLLALEPWREEAHRQLMLLLAAGGQRSAALAHYERCRRALADELGIAPSEETTALLERIWAGELEPSAEPLAARPPARSGPGALPSFRTSFIGRQEQLAALQARLADPTCRLLTLVGPGGSGKTRLAVQLAEALAPAFPDGVWFVGLADVAEAHLLVGAVATALGIQEGEGRVLLDLLADALRDRCALLVLDNCEHLTAACARLADHLLNATSALRMLATSRELLHASGEVVWPVPPLATALAAPGAPADETSSEAVQLFVERARLTDPAF